MSLYDRSPVYKTPDTGAGSRSRSKIRFTGLLRLLFISCLISLFIPGCGPSQDADETVYNRPLQIRYGFTLTNNTNRLVKNVRFRTFVPIRRTATQKRNKITASHPFEELDEGYGGPALLFKIGDLVPYSSRVVTIRTDLLLADQPVPSKRAAGDLFLLPEKYMESGHPEIIALAGRLRQRDGSSTARKVFDWVADNIEYTGYRKNPQGALYALNNRRGDCTEFTHLFVALCRANGIPARGIGGYICRKNAVLKPVGYHNWAEFYDGRTWRLADPLNRVFMQDQANYIAMIAGRGKPDQQTRWSPRYQVEGEGVTAVMNVF